MAEERFRVDMSASGFKSIAKDESSNGDEKEYECRFVKSGKLRGAGNREINVIVASDALIAAVGKGLFDGKACFVGHAGWFQNPKLDRMVGVSVSSRWNAGSESVDGVIKMYDTPIGGAMAAVIDSMIDDREGGDPVPDIGLSMVFWPRWKQRDNRDEPLVLAEIKYVESIDLVFEPAADGRVLQALSAYFVENPITGGNEMIEEKDKEKEVANKTEEWSKEVVKQSVTAILAAATDLPAASRERLNAGYYVNAVELRDAIKAEREYLAQLIEDEVITLGGVAPRDGGRIQMGMTGYEDLEAAALAMLSSEKPPSGVRPLSGIRELYILLSGDYEMTGLFQNERVQFANVTSATMANLVANALNKRIVNLFMQYPQWWKPIVTEEDFTSLQDARWITLGGVGELPTVAEGAAYTELTWDDQAETKSFVKKGGYLGLTIEAIDKDDTRRLQAAPRALAQAAWLTLAKAVSAIFTGSSGVGPTMADAIALFNASHSNLGSTALSHAAWITTRIAMRKQTEVNSSERLGALTAPKYLLVPPDLENTATQVLATEHVPGSANYNENILAQGDEHDARLRAARNRVIVIDLWTDTDNWALSCDPNLYPTIGLGFRYGRTPELFSVASPLAGLMFSNDVMPVKVRFFFAVGPMDYRGLYKHNV